MSEHAHDVMISCAGGSRLIGSLFDRHIRIVKPMMRRIMLGESFLLVGQRTVAVAIALGAIRPHRSFREAVAVQYGRDPFANLRISLKDEIGDHADGTMPVPAPGPGQAAVQHN